MTHVEILADSVDSHGQRITSVLCRYPRIIHTELMTHRVFSRSSSSTRAIPLSRQIDSVEVLPFFPEVWRKNAKGMQPKGTLSPADESVAEVIWDQALVASIKAARELESLGVAKEIAGRLLEPFAHIQVLITATEWDNFFNLRCHPDAQYEIRVLAEMIREKRNASTPRVIEVGEWHLPFSEFTEGLEMEEKLKVCVARCARLSYASHDGTHSLDKDLELYDRLASAGHYSPLEHLAVSTGLPVFYANFRGWQSYRNQLGF